MKFTMERIVNALKEQGGTEFQKFCDLFLYYKFPNRLSTALYGTQLEMRNSIKGHPDSFFRLADGRLFYVETTAQQTDLYNKIKKDLTEAISAAKNHAYNGKLNLIVNLKVKHQKKLDNLIDELSKMYDVTVHLNTLDSLALDIFLHYPMLGKYLVGIALDTGQLQPLEKFIKHYESRSHHLATTLTNTFVDRDGLHKKVSDHLENYDLIILNGSPGVGKTRMALETIRLFQVNHPDYRAYAIVPKYRDLVDDLDQTLQKDKKYILFIDDANRQIENFRYALGALLRDTTSLKIVISVRNYAIKEVDTEMADFKFRNILIQEFSNDQILAILESETYQITKYRVKQQIIKIAQGKPRIAIMAAILVQKNGGDFEMENALSIYEAYFQEILKDTGLFGNHKLLKVMGIMAFFYNLDLSDEELVNDILHHLNMESDSFMAAVYTLEQQEFLETYETHIKISEQLLSTYFFFKVFLQQKILSFQALLHSYYTTYYYRFRDVLSPILKTFPKEEAWTPIAPVLHQMLDETNQETTLLEIFELCRDYMPDRVLSYLSMAEKEMEEPEDPDYKILDNHSAYFPESRKLNLLAEFLKQDSIYFLPALELSWKYLRKKPELGAYFIQMLENALMQYQPTSDLTNREITFYENLKSKSDEPHIEQILIPLLTSYLLNPWIPEELTSKELKRNKLVWDLIQQIAGRQRSEFLRLLLKYDPEFRFREPAIFYQERDFLFKIIQRSLRPDKVIENFAVSELLLNLRKMNELPDSWSTLENSYQNEINQWNQALKWGRVMDYLDKYGKPTRQQSQLLQEEYFISSFNLKTISEFEKFIQHVSELYTFQVGDFWMERSLDLLVTAHFKKNPAFGFELLEVFQQNRLKHIILGETVRTIFSQVSEDIPAYWNRLQKFPVETRVHYQYRAIEHLPNELIQENYLIHLLGNLVSYNGNLHIDYTPFSKFEKFQKDLFEKIVQLIMKKNIEGCYLYMNTSFFLDYWDKFKNDYSWIKTIYFIQKRMEERPVRFDPQWQALKKIILHFPEFLYDFGVNFYPLDFSIIQKIHKHLYFIWNSETYFPWIKKLMDSLQAEEYTSSDNNDLKFIFLNETKTQRAIIHRYLQNYLLDNLDNYKRIDLVFRAAKLLEARYFKGLIITYLNKKPDLKQFKRIDWIREDPIISGKANLGVSERKKWEVIQSYVNEIPITLELFPIRDYIELQIIKARNSSKRERLREFLRK